MDLEENIYKKVKTTHYMLAGFAGQRVVSFLDFVIDVLLEGQSKRYRQILYLIDYIVYGLRLWYKI